MLMHKSNCDDYNEHVVLIQHPEQNRKKDFKKVDFSYVLLSFQLNISSIF